MLRKTTITFLILVFLSLIQGHTQPPTLVERLGVVGSTVHLEVRTIIKGSAADKGGLRPGDQLMIFDARPLTTGEDMLGVIGSAAAGQHELTILRDGKVKQIGVKLGPPGASRLGLAFVSGVRLVGMLKGSPAMRAGLQKDDLVTLIRLNDKELPTPTVEELERCVAAIPESQPFDIVYLHQDMVVTQTIQLTGAPATEVSPSAQGQATPAVQTAPQQSLPTSRGMEAGNRGQTAGRPTRPQYQRTTPAAGGERQGDYVTPPRETQAAPTRGGREPVAASPSNPTNARLAAREARMRLSSARGSGGAAAVPQRNATLDQMLVKANYAPPASVAKRITEINVLSYAFIDKNTGDAIFVGRYDPTYATGPIDYNALLADAVENPYPRFTLEYPGGNGRSPMAQMRSTLDAEFAHINRDPNYGVEWLGKLVLPVIKGESPDPDQQAALNAKLRASGITPESYRAYMKWQLGHFEDMQAYSEGASEFLPSMMQAVGLSRKTGEEITAYRLFASQGNRENLDHWCAVAGYTDLENKIVEEIRTTGNKNLARMELLPALYGSILRGLGVPEGQLNQILSQYKSGSGNEGLLVSPLEERYQAIFKQVLMDKVVNGMTFTGTTLSRQYGFAPILSPLNTYGARRDSPVMNVFFKADYILKFMTSSPRPAESIAEHQTSQAFLAAAENRAGGSAGRTPKSGVIRYWLYPQSVGMDTLSGNSGVHFREASVRVGVEALESEGADRTGMDFQKTVLDQYSARLTSLYDQYAKLYPALHALRETEKVVALARWAQKNGVRIRVAANNAPEQALPDTVQGFWGMTYIVRPAGDTDTMVTWAQGGVDFGQSAGDGWMQSGPPGREATDDALRSLAASTALSEKAAMAAKNGDLESARDLAERGAQAMSGNIDFTNVPKVPMPAMPEPDPASAAAVSEASIEAVDMNVAGLKEAKQNLTKAETLGTSDPQSVQLAQQGQELKSRSEENLTRLQTMLREYRNSPANGYQVAVDLRGLDPKKPATVALLHPAPLQPPQNTQPAVAPQPDNRCSPEVERALPSRQELLIELATRRIQLDGLKNTLVRFNRTIQMDQKQYADWEAEATKAVERLTDRRDAMIQDATFNCLTEVLKIRLDKDKTLSEAARKDQERKLELLQHLKTFNDFKEWALSHKDDWEMMDQGFRQLLEFLPLDENPGLSIGVHSAEALVDGAYDVADFYATWSNLAQLDRNSDQYLAIVKKNGEKMKELVTRIKELETQLEATPERPATTTFCKAAAGN